jgi:hypothetical protein
MISSLPPIDEVGKKTACPDFTSVRNHQNSYHLLNLPRSLSDIAFVTRRRRRSQMQAAGPEKPETYSLEYVEDFSGLRTMQMGADHSPQ